MRIGCKWVTEYPAQFQLRDNLPKFFICRVRYGQANALLPKKYLRIGKPPSWKAGDENDKQDLSFCLLSDSDD